MPVEHLELKTPSGKAWSFDAELDDKVARNGADGVEIVAEVGPSLIFIDSYYSVPGGMSYCQAGHERFLRVVTFGPPQPEEVLRLKLESCWQRIELEDPVKWSAETRTLHINWLFGPLARDPPEEFTIHIGTTPTNLPGPTDAPVPHPGHR
jgi:hypothetical protein